MKSNTFKNVKNRKFFFRSEISKKVQKYVLINHLSFSTNVFGFDTNFASKISKTKIKNKCIITGRNGSVNKEFSVSRIVFREFLSYGLISGYKKAVW
jgi:ribosomal protein S14